jgi:hypothetical protein
VDISRLDGLREIRVEERAGARGEDEAESVGEGDVVWVGARRYPRRGRIVSPL